MKLLNPSELKDILEDSAILGSNIFQNSREFNIFNTILSEAETYDASTFNFPVNAVRVWKMQDDKNVSSLEDIIDYMKFNKIPSIKQAVDNVCHENHIDKLALYLSLEGIMEAQSRAAKASKSHKAVAICKGCGKPVTECICSKSESADTAGICKTCQKPINECTCKKTESSNPDIAMFNNIMATVENCIDNDIEIVFKCENINEIFVPITVPVVGATTAAVVAGGALVLKKVYLNKVKKIIDEVLKSQEFEKYKNYASRLKTYDSNVLAPLPHTFYYIEEKTNTNIDEIKRFMVELANESEKRWREKFKLISKGYRIQAIANHFYDGIKVKLVLTIDKRK